MNRFIAFDSRILNQNNPYVKKTVPPMKKSKAELNDILCLPEDQHLDRVQENVFTHIK